MRTIAKRVYDPANSIFKTKKSDKAEAFELFCSCESCPLIAKKQCIHVGFLSRCPYGKKTKEEGPTQRARSYRKWVNDKKEASKGLSWPDSAPTKLAFIGEYVYLPYSHMTMCQAVPFLAHANIISSGYPFISKDFWTIETVLTLINFRPRGYFGGEIVSYQDEIIPRFITHIRELDKDMWQKLIEAKPELDKEPNYVGRKALLKTLAYPITIPEYDGRYPVSWIWDGKTARTKDMSAYNNTWGNIKLESLEIIAVPKEDASVVIKDNSWVTDQTEFVD